MLRKIFGSVMYTIFGKYLPSSTSFLVGKTCKRIRAFWARIILKKCGKNINVERNATFSRRVEIGDYSGLGKNCFISGKTIIGKYVMMGPNCHIYTRNHKFASLDTPMCQQGFTEEKVVVIGDDVWIGDRVSIMPGVKIGNGVVIAAGSVVTKDIPDYAVVGGVPAKVIKFRKK